MIKITDKHNCCGCSACSQACPKQCISFIEDTEGFFYPKVDESSCVDCGLCEHVCPILNQSKPISPKNVYAAQNKNEEELLQSSSGGVFILLARKIINEGGVVFGAKFDDKWQVIHAFAEAEEDVKQFIGSKYVQSYLGSTYQNVKTFLISGRKVLFSGTPCQIAGLKKFLRKDYDDLLTVDIICHGVPSPAVWKKYLEEIKQNARKGKNTVSLHHNLSVSERDTLEEDGGIEIESISFRDKKLGWQKFSFTLTLAEATADGKKNSVSLSHIHKEDPYLRLFLSNLILRPSCYQCPVKGGKSHSDITLADFWGIENSHPELDDKRGVGLLLINTLKGDSFIRPLNVSLYSVSLEEGIAGNSAYYKSVSEPKVRSKCFKLISKNKELTELIRLIDYVPLHVRVKIKLKLLFSTLFK